MSRRAAVAVAFLGTLVACAGDDTAEESAPSPASSDPASSAPAPSDLAPTAPATTAPRARTDTAAVTTPPARSDAPTEATTTVAPTVATTEPAGDPAVTFSEVATLEAPVDLAWREDDPGRYVVEQAGRIVRLDEADEVAVVLDITELTEADGEQGLLGLAFAPAGDLAYVNYIDGDGNTVIAEFPVDDDGTFRTGDEARTVLQIEQPYTNHNGGDLTFGPDGLLYIGMGDGGAGGDPERRATDMTSLLGKMLRIDPAIDEANATPYSVPADNPFVDDTDAAPEIWSSGLRNPWRFSFDRTTGDLWIADVGQGEQEEIDVAPATDGVDAGRGLSFGWSAFEGDLRFNDDVDPDGHTPPVFTYEHTMGGCSVSGGVRARGGPVATLEGWYVYGDFCLGTVWALEVTGDGAGLATGRQVELGNVAALTAIVDGPDGELYALSQQGPVLRLDPLG